VKKFVKGQAKYAYRQSICTAVTVHTDPQHRKDCMLKKLAFTSLVMVIMTGTAIASKPIQLSLTPDIAVFSRTERIQGLSLSIWGENPQSSLALGIVNGFAGMSKGFALGFLNYADRYKGFQFGAVNYMKSSMHGCHLGFVNYVESSARGIQVGAFNYASQFNGVQLGVINYVKSTETKCLQIGIFNLISQNRWFEKIPDEGAPGMLLINWRF